MNTGQRLNLILGLPVPVESGLFTVKQFTLKEIALMGYETYHGNISLLLMTVDDFLKTFMDTDAYMDLYTQRHSLSPLDFHSLMCEDKTYRNSFERAISFVLDIPIEQVSYEVSSSQLLLYGESDDDVKLIDKELFNEMVHIIKVINGFESISEDDDNPYDDKAREILEKLKKGREKVDKVKNVSDKETPQTIVDIISALTARSPSTNKINILDYTLYQVYDELARIHIINGYDISISSLMFGGSKEIPSWDRPR